MANILLEESDLIERWEVSLSALQQWRWTGAGPKYFKIGRKVLYRLVDVETFENNRLRHSTSSYINNKIQSQKKSNRA